MKFLDALVVLKKEDRCIARESWKEEGSLKFLLYLVDFTKKRRLSTEIVMVRSDKLQSYIYDYPRSDILAKDWFVISRKKDPFYNMAKQFNQKLDRDYTESRSAGNDYK